MQYLALDIETTGLDPETDRITCIGIMSSNGIIQFSETTTLLKTKPEMAEENILLKFRAHMKEAKALTLITYNGVNFDLKFIAARMKKHFNSSDGEITRILYFHPHIDLAVFSKKLNGNRNISKEFACHKIGNIYVPRSSSGLFLARIYTSRTFTEQDHYEMLQHNAIDLAATLKFYNHLQIYPDFKSFEVDTAEPIEAYVI